MVFKVTITIEWNGWGQPLGSMVFRWFWGKTTIGNDGFRWLCTIGPTMEWLCTIVEVYIRGRKRFLLIREVCTWPRTPVWWQVFAMRWLETSWSPSRLHLRESLLARLLNLAVGFCFSICDLKVMVAEAIDITRETYFCIAMDRDSNGPVIVARWEIALK